MVDNEVLPPSDGPSNPSSPIRQRRGFRPFGQPASPGRSPIKALFGFQPELDIRALRSGSPVFSSPLLTNTQRKKTQIAPFSDELLSDDGVFTSPLNVQFKHKGRLQLPSEEDNDVPAMDLDEPAPMDGIESTPLTMSKASLGQKRGWEGRHARKAAKEAEVKVFKQGVLDRLMKQLDEDEVKFSEIMFLVFDPEAKNGSYSWDRFLKKPGSMSRLLDGWASSKSNATSRLEIHNWAMHYSCKVFAQESKRITDSGYLQSHNREINEEFVTGFDMKDIKAHLRAKAPAMLQALTAMATSTKASLGYTAMRLVNKATVVTSAAVSLLGEYSHANNRSRINFGLYAYASGAQRQLMAAFAHMGISASYPTLTGKARASQPIQTAPKHDSTTLPTVPPPPGVDKDELEEEIWMSRPRKAGAMRLLSQSMQVSARTVALLGLFGVVYDNINMVFKAAEQTMGHQNSQENGTCATMWPLFKAVAKDMTVDELNRAFLAAAPLSIKDILLSPNETKTFNECLIFCALRIIITHGGEAFKKFEKDLGVHQVITNVLIELHKTVLYPLPAMEIDESTMVGNAEVVERVLTELGVLVKGAWKKAKGVLVKFFAGDQLSIARLRALVTIRAGHKGGFTSFRWGVWIPGLFHAKIADMHGLFNTHWGKPNAGIRNPGSLHFHNTCLNRHPIVLTSLPLFRVCRDLIFVLLYARVLHCLLKVLGKASLEEYTESVSLWEEFYAHGKLIVETYASTARVEELRWNRKMDGPTGGDMVFENASLFLRDALISREFSDAVKVGDSGRVLLVLKMWALSYRGSGRTKYAYKMLHIVHNVSSVWSKAIRDIVLNNWLLNPTGWPYSFVEVDLVQEHQNFWIKSFYKAHGSASSWDWLAMISPCVNVLRHLATCMNSMLGSDQGTIHAPPDLSRDIPVLINSLASHEVYDVTLGRVTDADDPPATNIITLGLQSLTDLATNALTEYNRVFRRLQACCRMSVIYDGTPKDDAEVLLSPQATGSSGTSPLSPSVPLSTQSMYPVTRAHIYAPDTTSLTNTGDLAGPSSADSDSEEDEDEGEGSEDEEGLGEFEEVFDEEPKATLPRLSAGDVSLDMDTKEDGPWYDDGDIGAFEKEEEEGGGEIPWSDSDRDEGREVGTRGNDLDMDNLDNNMYA